MKNTSENSVSEPVSRGEKRIQETENFENVLSKNSINTETKTASESLYNAENSELDALLDQSTATKAENTLNEKAEVSQSVSAEHQPLSIQKSAALAVGALQELCDAAAKYTGRKLVFGEKFVRVYAAAAAPVISKYSRHVNLDPEKVDLDSWMPEFLAFGSVAAVGTSVFMQCREPIEHKAENSEEVKGGDKSEPST